MDNRYRLMKKGSGIWQSVRDGDFEEDEVWDVLIEKKESNPKIEKSIESSVSVPRNVCSAAIVIPRANSSHETRKIQQSAPVKIPEWSNIPKKQIPNSWLQLDDEEEESDCSYKLPPHEVIAKRIARSQIPSFSVFEGVGRKLKGRDLSQVRNAVLVKTGFLESP